MIKKIFILVTGLSVLIGCASTRNTARKSDTLDLQTNEKRAETVPEEIEVLPDLQNIKDEELEQYVQKKGVIFAKTDFQGLMKTRYVKFLFVDQEDPTHKFQLHIGESTGQTKFPWDVKTVKPGYFFVELPAGKYTISEVTIPVGSTTATEKMNVRLEVIPDAICYVGTLKMVGTKERIKLGGVPVIKPGFEFTVDILDEREEGAAAFSQNYPNFPHGVTIKLMEINTISAEE